MIAENILSPVKNIVEANGARVIECKLLKQKNGYFLRCLVDYLSGGITVETCARINRKIYQLLGETKLLGEDFAVEVSSPGLDRKLKTYEDFLPRKGRLIDLYLKEKVEGRIFFAGKLIETEKDFLTLSFKDKLYHIPFDKINFGKEKLI